MVREGYLPEATGDERKIRFGGLSLTGGLIRLRMDQIRLRYNNKEVEEVIRRIENIFLAKKTDNLLEKFVALEREVHK